MRLLPALGVVLAVSACGPVPQPFRPEDGAPPNPLLDLPDIPGIYVPPVEGTTLPMGNLLARSVAEALNDKDVPAFVNEPRTVRYRLAGRAEAEPDGAVRAIRWRLVDPQNHLVAEHREAVDGPTWRWEYGDPKLLRAIGSGVATAFAPVARPEDPTLNAAPEPPPFAVHVAPVEGAPGDGNASLRSAMRAALGAAGVPLRDSPDGAAVLRGRVEVGPARQGTQPVRIVWDLSDAAGKRIGEAAQANSVPAGSLDGPWRQVATYAVQGAMDGVGQLVGAARRGPTPAEARETLRRDVPQVPGRGLPPPE